MRIAKYVHSCLLLEEAGEKLLFDPGTTSFVEGRVTPEEFGDVATILITHTHPDHLDVAALQRIVALSGAQVLGNGEVAAMLRPEGIDVSVFEDGTRRVGPFELRAIPTPHEAILADRLPQHTAVLVNERVLNCGDSFAEPMLAHAGIELLAMPVMAPFLTELGAFDFARRMRPQQVLPLHDGYARDFFLRQRYDNYGPRLEQIGIRFHALLEPGAAVSLSHKGTDQRVRIDERRAER